MFKFFQSLVPGGAQANDSIETTVRLQAAPAEITVDGWSPDPSVWADAPERGAFSLSLGVPQALR